MGVITQTVDTGPVEVDVCQSCQIVWFDSGEDTDIAGALPAEKPDPLAHLSEEDRQEVRQAQARLALSSAKLKGDYQELPDSCSSFDQMGALFGIPVEAGAPPRSIFPVLSWGLVLAMAVGTLFAMSQGDLTYESYGFLAESPLHGGGVAALAGLLIDPRMVSVFLNAVVFIRLGDNVEDLFGHFGFVALLAAATLAGWGVHALVLATPGHPMFGLTSAAAAVAVVYALRFPHVQLGWYYYRRAGFFRDQESGWTMQNVRWVVLEWLLLASATPWMMSEPEAPNSWAEALVGAAVGAVAWGLFGQGVLRHPDAERL